jgi:hypothetical protein
LPEAAYDYLARLAKERPRRSRKTSGTAIPEDATADASGEVEAADARAVLERECQDVATAPEGSRNDTLNKAAFALGPLVAAGVLDRADVERRLTEAARQCGMSDAETVATIASGLDAGEARPRDSRRGKKTKQSRDSNRAESDDGDKKETQFEVLLRISDGAVLFHDATHRPYASITVGNHAEVLSLRSNEFRLWLRHQFFSDQDHPPCAESFQQAINQLEAEATYNAPMEAVHLRVAGQGDAILIDLGDPDWRVVEITSAGWRVMDRSPVRFRRPRDMGTLPIPQQGGSLDLLRPFANCSESDCLLIIAWLAAALRPAGPYPVLVLTGEQGTAKTTLAKILKCLIDPHVLKSRSAPRDERDLAIAANNNLVVLCENVSSLPPWMSDAFCRLCTGSGWGTRQLWSDDEEQIFAAQRPIILEGITDFVDRPDLMDRCVFVHLSPIPEDKRRKESECWKAFEAAAPLLLGALLDAVAGGLAVLPTLKLSSLPRMADFAEFGEAVSRALGKPPGEFLDAYRDNRKSANESALDDSPIAGAIRTLASQTATGWTGTASGLLEALGALVSDKTRESRRWPKSPKAMGGAVRRLAPQLRMIGVDVVFHRVGKDGARTIEISSTGTQGEQPDSFALIDEVSFDEEIDPTERDREQPSEPSEPSATLGTQGQMADGRNGQPSATVSRPSASPGRETSLADDADGTDGSFPESPAAPREIIEI